MESFEQLQKTYAGMPDEELAAVASDAYDLTEIARQALQTEIAKRGLNITPRLAPDAQPEHDIEEDEDEDPDSSLHVVASVHSPEEARLLQAVLNSHAIRSCLGPDNVDDVDSFRGAFDKGVDLKVYFPFSGKAGTLIHNARRGMPAELQQEDDPDDVREDVPEEDLLCAGRCPICRSEEIVFDGRAAEAGSEPGPDAKFDWHCDACGHVWEDDGTED